MIVSISDFSIHIFKPSQYTINNSIFWLIPSTMGYLMQWVSLSFLISQSAWLIEDIVGFVCQHIFPLSSDKKKKKKKLLMKLLFKVSLKQDRNMIWHWRPTTVWHSLGKLKSCFKMSLKCKRCPVCSLPRKVWQSTWLCFLISCQGRKRFITILLFYEGDEMQWSRFRNINHL